MDYELRVVNSVVKEGNYKGIVDNKIDGSFFYGGSKKYFTFIKSYFDKYGKIPDVRTMKATFPEYTQYKLHEPLEFYCEKLRDRKLYNTIKNSVEDIAEELPKDLHKALGILKSTVLKINTEISLSKDVDLASSVDRRIAQYEQRKLLGEIIGIPTGYAPLDNMTQGWQKEDLIVLIASTNIGKTFMLLRMGYEAWKAGYKPLFISKEMTIEQIEMRFDALHSEIEPKKIRSGRMTLFEEEKYNRKMQELKETEKNFIISGDDFSDGFGGVSSVRAKIKEYQPDLVLIDGLYLLEDERGGQDFMGVRNVIRDLKALARSVRVPIIASSQTNQSEDEKVGAGFKEVAYSKEISRVSDMMIFLHQTKDMKEQRELFVQLKKNRNGEVGAFKVKWDLEEMKFQVLDSNTTEEVEQIVGPPDRVFF